MGGSKQRTEGNCASKDLSLSLGESRSSDLGLTLFPGPQTQRQRQDEKSGPSHELIFSLHCSPASHKKQDASQNGMLQWPNVPSSVTKPVQGNVKDNNDRRNDFSAFQSRKRRRLDRRSVCSLTDCGTRKAVSTDILSKPDVNVAGVAGSTEASHVKAHHEAGKGIACVEHRLREVKQWKTLGKVCSSGHASVSDPTEFAIPSEQSCNACSFYSPQNPALTSESVGRFPQAVNALFNGAKSHEESRVVASSALKSLKEPRRISSSVAFDLNLSALPNSQRQQASLPSSFSGPPDICRADSGSSTRVLRSWTSHFPKASKRLGLNRYPRCPAPFSPTDSSLNPNANHQHTSIRNYRFTNPRGFQEVFATISNQHQLLLDDNPSPLEDSAFSLKNCVLGPLSGWKPGNHQQRLTHKRAVPLPSLFTKHHRQRKSIQERTSLLPDSFSIHRIQRHSSRRRAISLPSPLLPQYISIMDSRYIEKRSMLPTPPIESRLLDSHHQPWNSHCSPFTAAFTGTKPLNSISNMPGLHTSTNSCDRQELTRYHDSNAMFPNSNYGGDNRIYPSDHMLNQDMAGNDESPQLSTSNASYSSRVMAPTQQQQLNDEAICNNGFMPPTPRPMNSHVAHNHRSMPSHLQQWDIVSACNDATETVVQQPNHPMLPQKASYSFAEFEDYNRQLHHFYDFYWGARMDKFKCEECTKYTGFRENLMDQMARKDFEHQKLAQYIELLEQQEADLSRRLRSHERGEIFQRLQQMGTQLSPMRKRITDLKRQNTELERTNQRLLSEMQKLAAKPRPDAAIAKDILQKAEPPPADLLDSHVDGNQHNTPQSPSSPSLVSQTRCPNEASTSPTTPNQMKETAVTRRNGYLNSEAIATANGHFAIPLSTNFPAMPISMGQLASDVPQRFENAPYFTGSSGTANVPCNKVTIDLTNDSMQPSDPCNTSDTTMQGLLAHAQPLPVQIPQDLQSHVKFTAEFSKKPLTWLDGNHPGKVSSTYGMNFGLASGKKSPQEQPSNAQGALPKKVKGVFDAAASVRKPHKEQTQKEQGEKRRVKQAEHSRKDAQKKRAEKARAKQSESSSQTAARALDGGKQPRKSAKQQKRQDRAREPLEQFQRRVSQEPVAQSHEDCTDGQEDMEWDQDLIIEDPDSVRDAEGVEDGFENQDLIIEDPDSVQNAGGVEGGFDDDDAFAAALEAQMTADAEAEQEESNGGNGPAEKGVYESTSADNNAVEDDSGYQEGSESKESEEE